MAQVRIFSDMPVIGIVAAIRRGEKAVEMVVVRQAPGKAYFPATVSPGSRDVLQQTGTEGVAGKDESRHQAVGLPVMGSPAGGVPAEGPPAGRFLPGRQTGRQPQVARAAVQFAEIPHGHAPVEGPDAACHEGVEPAPVVRAPFFPDGAQGALVHRVVEHDAGPEALAPQLLAFRGPFPPTDRPAPHENLPAPLVVDDVAQAAVQGSVDEV